MQTDLKGQSKARQERGMALLRERVPERVNETTYLIPSSDGSTQYKIRHLDAYSCTCPDYTNRCKENGLYCKHINAIIFLNKLKNKVELEDFALEDITEKKACEKCKSEKIIKQGMRKNKGGNKQKYKCLECGAYFIIDPAKHLKGNARMVCLVLDMYYKGNSLRDIKDTLYKNFGLKLHHETIRRWINRFMERIGDYTATLKPQTSDTIHLDEQSVQVGKENEWCWNALDNKTRFLLATQVTKARRIDDARSIIQKTKRVVSQRPKVIATDKGPFYVKAIQTEFFHKGRNFIIGRNRQSVDNVIHATRKMDNQIIERYHGTFRERDKVIRGLKSEASAERYMQNWKTYYNFVRPHTSLGGLTPSEKAGISIGAERNRWMGLVKLSV